MGILSRLFGADDQAPTQPRRNARSDDEIAIERYRYLLRTAPPETIEEVHREAFSKLTPAQRQLLFEQLSENAPAGDAPRGPDAASLASSATRSELRNPGTVERSMGGGGMGFGSMVASSLLGTVAGYVIGSALVSAFDFGGADDGSSDASDSGDQSTDQSTDQSGDTSADTADASADGGDFGDFDSDFGGGDFF